MHPIVLGVHDDIDCLFHLAPKGLIRFDWASVRDKGDYLDRCEQHKFAAKIYIDILDDNEYIMHSELIVSHLLR